MKFDYPQTMEVMVFSEEDVRAVYGVLAGKSVRPLEADPVMPELTEAELDSAGVAFDPELHTGTKLKDGRWRMKKGAERQEPVSAAEVPASEPLPSADDAGEEIAIDAEESLPQGEAEESSDDDEFAAFREAAAQAETSAPVTVPERKWTDADMSALLAQAVTKMGGGAAAAEVKKRYAKYMPEGVPPHSRHIPLDKREEFAQEIEAWADIEFAG